MKQLSQTTSAFENRTPIAYGTNFSCRTFSRHAPPGAGHRLGNPKRYTIRGLLEIDVTLPRQILREHKARAGETLSFTAFLTACTGQEVAKDKGVQAMRNWRGDLVIFEDVDISILVERQKEPGVGQAGKPDNG